MKYTASVHLLSEKFIKHYPLSNSPELMYKAGRPYACLLIETHEGYTICIPFRSSIKHKNAFIFRGLFVPDNPDPDWIIRKWLLLMIQVILTLSRRQL